MNLPAKLSLLLAGVCAVLPVTGLLAQEPLPGATPSVSMPVGPSQPDGPMGPQDNQPGGPRGQGQGQDQRRGRMRAAMAALSPDERQELRAARRKARQDPAVQAAMRDRQDDPRAFHKVMRQAVLRADPNVQPILEKMRSRLRRKDFQTT